MASDFSAYIANKIARWMAGNAMPTAPTSLYVALFDGNPASGGSEVTTTIASGGRLAVTWDSIADDGADNVLTSAADVDFGESEGAADITHIGIMDAASSGNLVFPKALAAPLSVEVGDPVKINSGDLSITIAKAA
jgi:hypothetical protein